MVVDILRSLFTYQWLKLGLFTPRAAWASSAAIYVYE